MVLWPRADAAAPTRRGRADHSIRIVPPIGARSRRPSRRRNTVALFNGVHLGILPEPASSSPFVFSIDGVAGARRQVCYLFPLITIGMCHVESTAAPQRQKVQARRCLFTSLPIRPKRCSMHASIQSIVGFDHSDSLATKARASKSMPTLSL
jgi:hypothetical protein